MTRPPQHHTHKRTHTPTHTHTAVARTCVTVCALHCIGTQPASHTPNTHHREQQFYKLAAVAATLGVTGLAILATYLRFYWHLRDAGEMPWGELVATLALVGGGVVRVLCFE